MKKGIYKKGLILLNPPLVVVTLNKGINLRDEITESIEYKRDYNITLNLKGLELVQISTPGGYRV